MSVREMFQVHSSSFVISFLLSLSKHVIEYHPITLARVAPCCNVNVTWPLIVVTFGPTHPHGQCECLCVCLERLLLGPYQPSLSLWPPTHWQWSDPGVSVQRVVPVTKHTERGNNLQKI